MDKQAEKLNWPELLEDYRASSQSMAKWCQANNLKVHQLAYRLQKAKQSEQAETNWLPLDITTETDAVIQIKIGQALIQVQENFDPLLLKQVIRVLSSI